jgi:hypothetical protein
VREHDRAGLRDADRGHTVDQADRQTRDRPPNHCQRIESPEKDDHSGWAKEHEVPIRDGTARESATQRQVDKLVWIKVSTISAESTSRIARANPRMYRTSWRPTSQRAGRLLASNRGNRRGSNPSQNQALSRLPVEVQRNRYPAQFDES